MNPSSFTVSFSPAAPVIDGEDLTDKTRNGICHPTVSSLFSLLTQAPTRRQQRRVRPRNALYQQQQQLRVRAEESFGVPNWHAMSPETLLQENEN
jgi:hypothetical protein